MSFPRGIINCVLLIDNVARAILYDIGCLCYPTIENRQCLKLHLNAAQLNLIECIRSIVQIIPVLGNFLLIDFVGDSLNSWEAECLDAIEQ